jgi:hypothetical protein
MIWRVDEASSPLCYHYLQVSKSKIDSREAILHVRGEDPESDL